MYPHPVLSRYTAGQIRQIWQCYLSDVRIQMQSCTRVDSDLVVEDDVSNLVRIGTHLASLRPFAAEHPAKIGNEVFDLAEEVYKLLSTNRF